MLSTVKILHCRTWNINSRIRVVVSTNLRQSGYGDKDVEVRMMTSNSQAGSRIFDCINNEQGAFGYHGSIVLISYRDSFYGKRCPLVLQDRTKSSSDNF